MNRKLIDEYPLIVLPSLAKKIGLNEAIVLQQIHFWLGRGLNKKDGKYWVYNTYEEWGEQFPFWSVSTIRRAFSSLQNQNLLIVGNYNKSGFDNTKWYTINYEQLKRMSRPSVQSEQTGCSKWTDGSDQNEQTNTIDYTENNNIDSNSSSDNVFEFYESNFGVLSPYISEAISKWINDLSDELVIESLKIATKAGERRFRYAEGILRDWHNKGLKTLDDVRAAEVEHKNRKSNKGSNRRRLVSDIDWEAFDVD